MPLSWMAYATVTLRLRVLRTMCTLAALGAVLGNDVHVVVAGTVEHIPAEGYLELQVQAAVS
jgi:hypothetical protein